MIKLPSYQYSTFIGIMLSDGFLSLNLKTGSTNAFLEFAQSFEKFDYVFFVFNILGHYCNKMPKFRSMKKTNSPTTHSLRFTTRSLPCFTEIYHLFYVNGVKIVPLDIYNLLTPIALAHFIMGDGARSGNGLLLCTDSFSLKDIIRIMNVLIIKFDLECTLRTNQHGYFRIAIKTKSMIKLRAIVLPHMHPSMYYKLGINS